MNLYLESYIIPNRYYINKLLTNNLNKIPHHWHEFQISNESQNS